MPMPPDIQYCVDSMEELGDIRPFHGSFARRFHGPDWTWFDEESETGGIGFGTMSGAERLKLKYDEWLLGASDSQKQVLLADTVSAFVPSIKEVILGFLMKYIDGRKGKLLLKQRGLKEVTSRRYIRRAIRNIPELQHMLSEMEKFHSAIAPTIENYRNGVKGGIALNITEREAAREEIREVLLREGQHEVIRGPHFYRWKQKQLGPQKKEVKKKRKALFKSYTMLSKFLGKNAADLYIGGTSVVITGNHLKIKVTKNCTSSTNWRTNNIDIYDLNDNYLCRSCVYFDSTPAPEQIVSFFLLFKSGRELEVITGGNISRISEIGYKFPAITEMVQRQSTRIPAELCAIIDGINNLALSSFYGVDGTTVANKAQSFGYRKLVQGVLSQKLDKVMAEIPVLASIQSLWIAKEKEQALYRQSPMIEIGNVRSQIGKLANNDLELIPNAT